MKHSKQEQRGFKSNSSTSHETKAMGNHHNKVVSTEALALTVTDNGNEFTIDSSYTNTGLVATLDDATGAEDSIIVNFTMADGTNQEIVQLNSNGIENITLNITEDETNATDDLVDISSLFVDSASVLTIISQESVQIDKIQSSTLQTIDLTAATAGFEIEHTHSQTGVTYLLDTIGDGIGKLNIDTDADGVADTSASSIELNYGVQDTIVFSATSLENSLLIEKIQVGTDLTADLIDLSAFGITSIDELTFTDGNYDNSENCATSTNDVMITSDSFAGTIILSGVSSSDIDASNFIFA